MDELLVWNICRISAGNDAIFENIVKPDAAMLSKQD